MTDSQPCWMRLDIDTKTAPLRDFGDALYVRVFDYVRRDSSSVMQYASRMIGEKLRLRELSNDCGQLRVAFEGSEKYASTMQYIGERARVDSWIVLGNRKKITNPRALYGVEVVITSVLSIATVDGEDHVIEGEI